jgi:hypothetical protein
VKKKIILNIQVSYGAVAEYAKWNLAYMDNAELNLAYAIKTRNEI